MNASQNIQYFSSHVLIDDQSLYFLIKYIEVPGITFSKMTWNLLRIKCLIFNLVVGQKGKAKKSNFTSKQLFYTSNKKT